MGFGANLFWGCVVPVIQITNNSALDLTASTDDKNAAINRYLKDVLTLKAPVSVDALVKLKISDLDPVTFPVNLAASENTQFAAGQSTLTVQGGASATIGLLGKDDAGAFLDGLQASAEPGPDAIVSFALGGTVSAGGSGSVSDLSLGLTENASATFTTYMPAGKDDSFVDCVRKAVTSLTIPREIDDLAALPVNTVCQVHGASSLQFTASVSYSFLNNPLATTAIPKLPSIAVNARADATVEATATHSAGHAVTIARVSENLLHLSVSLTRTDDFETSLTVTAGLSAEVGNTDALAFLLDKISPNSATEMEKIAKDLPPAKAEQLSGDVRRALNAAVSNSLQASLKSAIDSSRSKDRLFLYEIDLAALADSGRAALASALRGDFTALTGSQLAGVRELDSALTDASTVTHSLAVHLLGIFNYGDTNTFIESSVIDFTKDTHEIVLSDERIQVMTNSLKSEKVREVVLKGMTLTLPASATTPEAATPINLVFYNREAAASASKRRQFINVLRLAGSREASAASGLANFGVCSLYLGLDLTPPQCRQLFIDDAGRPHEWTFFVSKVCEAQQAILADDSDSAARLKLFNAGMDVWTRLADAGSQPNTMAVLKSVGISDMEVPDAFTTLWWAEAMGDYAKAVASGASLERVGRGVVAQSSTGFNEPWLLIAAWSILGRPQQIKTMFTSSLLKPAMSAGS